MRILIITTQDKFFISHVKERALYFKKQGCVVGVAAQQTSPFLSEEIRSCGFVFYDTKIERRSVNPLSELLSLLRLLQIQKHFRPDVSYHLGAKAIFYGTLTARLSDNKVKIVNAPIGLGYVFASNSILAKLLRPITMYLYRYFLNPSKSRVIIENDDDIKFFVRHKCLNPKDAFCILGAGVNTSTFVPIKQTRKNSICTVVMVSRLIKEKGVWDFVSVANKLYDNNVNVRMVLVGEPDFGNPSSITKKEYEEIQNNPAVECIGFKKNVLPFLQEAHIFCLPSYYREGLPRALIEATSVGLAILTTDTVGCKEVVRERNGFLFPPHDVKKLFTLIEFLVENPKEREKMGKLSRQVALRYFDSSLICKRTYQVIMELYKSY